MSFIPTSLRLFSSVFLWNFGLGISNIVVPLYASYLGFSLITIGSLFALPVAVQIILGLVSGATTDRWGGRNTLIISCAAPLAAGLIFSFADSLVLMLAGQVALSVGRGIFWPASQSIASNLPGERSTQMGRLNASVSGGQILGTAGAGVLLGLAGFLPVFLTLAGFNLVALFICLHLPNPKQPQPAGTGGLFTSFGPLLKTPRIYYALLCAYICAQPVSLGQSFLPLLFQQIGFVPEQIGPMMSLRAIGATFTALVLARLIGSNRGPLLATLGATTIGAGLMITAQADGPLQAIFAMSLIGMAAGILLLFYQLVVTDFSHGGNRGAALAIAGTGWSFSHITAPFVVGVLADQFGLQTAFTIWGGLLILLGLTLIPLNRRTLRS